MNDTEQLQEHCAKTPPLQNVEDRFKDDDQLKALLDRVQALKDI